MKIAFCQMYDTLWQTPESKSMIAKDVGKYKNLQDTNVKIKSLYPADFNCPPAAFVFSITLRKVAYFHTFTAAVSLSDSQKLY